MNILYWILGIGGLILTVIVFLLYRQERKAIERINKEYEDFNN